MDIHRITRITEAPSDRDEPASRHAREPDPDRDARLRHALRTRLRGAQRPGLAAAAAVDDDLDDFWDNVPV